MQPNQHLRILTISSMLMLVLSIYMVFVYAPLEIVMGAVQRVFYYHVASGWIGALAFLITLICSILYLATRNLKWDHVALSSVEIGVVFTSMNIVSGSVWARPIWNTWWTWEPRLTTTLILWLIYVAYLMVRSYAPTQSKGAIYAAVVGIIGFVDVPIVYYSVVWWRSIHPSPVVGPFAQADSLERRMSLILLFSLITFLFFFVYMVVERIELRRAEEALGQIRFYARRRDHES